MTLHHLQTPFSRFFEGISHLMTRFILASCLLLALALRLPFLSGSFWLDEAAQALEVTRPWHQQLEIAPDFQPPLLHLWLHLFAQISTAEWWLRVWGALIPGLVSIWFAILITKKLLGNRSAFWMGLLLATNSLHLFFSQELRPYALPAAWAAASWWFLLSNKRWSFALTTLAGLYSSYLYPFLLIGQFAYLGWKKTWRPFVLPSLAAMIGFLPWLPAFYEQLQVGGALRRQLPGWDQVVSLPQWKALALTPAKFIFGLMELSGQSVLVLSVLSGLFASLLIGTFFIRHPLISWLLTGHPLPFWNKPVQKIALDADMLTSFSLHKLQSYLNAFSTPLVVGLTWFVVPFLTSWLVSWWVPVISPKRLLFALPAFYLFALMLPRFKKFRFSRELVVLTLLFINFATISQYWTQPLYQRENWRALHAQISATYQPSNTLLVFGFTGPFSPWEWYERKSQTDTTYLHHPDSRPEMFPTLSTGYLTTADSQTKVTQKLVSARDYQTVLVFDYLRDLTDPQNLIIQELESLGFEEIGAIEYPNIGFVRILERQPSYAHRL